MSGEERPRRGSSPVHLTARDGGDEASSSHIRVATKLINTWHGTHEQVISRNRIELITQLLVVILATNCSKMYFFNCFNLGHGAGASCYYKEEKEKENEKVMFVPTF